MEIDGVATTLKLQSGRNNYTLFESDAKEEHTLRFLKRNELALASLGLKSVSTDGYFLTAPKRKELKIEVFGDSITSGYGVLASSTSELMNADNSDGLKTYAYLEAMILYNGLASKR